MSGVFEGGRGAQIHRWCSCSFQLQLHVDMERERARVPGTRGMRLEAEEEERARKALRVRIKIFSSLSPTLHTHKNNTPLVPPLRLFAPNFCVGFLLLLRARFLLVCYSFALCYATLRADAH